MQAEHPGGQGDIVCPRCRRPRVTLLTSMRRYDPRDWYKCAGCEHIYTMPRAELAGTVAAKA